jgi:hypothetical protein
MFFLLRGVTLAGQRTEYEKGRAYAALILLRFCGGWPWLLTKRIVFGCDGPTPAPLPTAAMVLESLVLTVAREGG